MISKSPVHDSADDPGGTDPQDRNHSGHNWPGLRRSCRPNCEAVKQVKLETYPVDAANADGVSPSDIVELCEDRHRTSQLSVDPVATGRDVVAVAGWLRLFEIEQGVPIWQSDNRGAPEYFVIENGDQARSTLAEALEWDAEADFAEAVSIDDCNFVDVEVAPHYRTDDAPGRVPRHALEPTNDPYPACRPRKGASVDYAPA